ncbi:MAG: TIGR02147 family protein [Myxococcota bacterium]
MRPRPQDYPDYRGYLRDMFGYLKATRPQFSYRFFSRLAGFTSPNFLKLVAEGQRNLTPASIPKFAKGLGLDETERDAFETLVLLTHAPNDTERNRYYAKLRKTDRGENEARRVEAAQFDVYSSWYALPIRELLLHPDFVEDPKWIASQLRPKIKPQEAAKALEILERVGLIARDPTGKLRPADTNISTGPRTRSLAVRNFHRAMMSLAADALETVPIDERDVTGLTVSLTPAQYGEVRARIERFRKELLDLIGPPIAESEIHQIGFLLFPLSRKDSR